MNVTGDYPKAGLQFEEGGGATGAKCLLFQLANERTNSGSKDVPLLWKLAELKLWAYSIPVKVCEML